MSARYIWVVEMEGEHNGRWSPTVGVGLNERDATEMKRQWRKNNPTDRFRIVRYRYVSAASAKGQG